MDELLKQSVSGELPLGIQACVAREFRCSDVSIGRIWCRYRETKANDGLGVWKSRIKQNCGRTPTRLLLESELFRLKKGSHTDDLHTRPASPNI
ncbi:hypothetical protein PC128_g10075 [Phytophthora cactorum]|nr:hypothetical protein PC128_g10075 [Phytophthora cactorum]